MASYLRRGKVADMAFTSVILFVYSVVHFIVSLSGHRSVNRTSTIYTIFMAIAAPLAFLSSIPLLFFWRKDKSIDRYYLSTATSRQLLIIMVATTWVFIPTASVIAAEVTEVVDFLRGSNYWHLFFSILVILVLCWIAQDTITTALYVNKCRLEVLEIEMAVGNREQANKDQPALAPPSYV